MKQNVFISYSAKENERSINKKTFDKLISNAEDLMITGNWNNAIEKFRKSIPFYEEGYNPDINLIRLQIRICSEEILYIKNIERGRLAYKEKSYKKSVKYYKDALSFKKSKSIEKKLIESKKKYIRNKTNNNYIQPSSNTPKKRNTFTINYKLLSFVLFFLVLVLSIIILQKYFPYEISIKRRSDLNTNFTQNKDTDKKNTVNNLEVSKTNIEKTTNTNFNTIAYINQKYLEEKLIIADNLTKEKKAIKALLFIEKINTKTFLPAQKEILNNKIRSIINLKVGNIKESANYYISKNIFNKRTHNYIFNQISSLILIKTIQKHRKKELINICYKLNKIYVFHYIQYANTLVKEHKYKKAKENLRFLQNQIIYPTKYQDAQISNKIADIEQIEQMIKKF